MALVLIVYGNNRKDQVSLTHPEYILGRDPGCDIYLADTEVSRRHARISIVKEISSSDIVPESVVVKVMLEDLKSLNGTFVNGQQIHSYQLQIGDRIQMGGTLMLLASDSGRNTEENRNMRNMQNAQNAQNVQGVQCVPDAHGMQDVYPTRSIYNAGNGVSVNEVNTEEPTDESNSEGFNSEEFNAGRNAEEPDTKNIDPMDPVHVLFVPSHAKNGKNASDVRVNASQNVLDARDENADFFENERFSASGTGLDAMDVTMSSANDQAHILKTISHKEGEKFLVHKALGKPNSRENHWTGQAQEYLQLLYEMTLSISHCMDIDRLSNELLDLIFDRIDADRGCILLFDSVTNRLVPRAKKVREQVEDSKMIISKTILDYVLEHREGVLTSDASEDKRWDEAASVVSVGIHEAICVPLQGRYGIVGAIYLDTFSCSDGVTQRNVHRFNDDHLRLMITIAHHTAIAVEDTRYYRGMLQAERLAAIGQTVATLSHHIKNILQGIQGGSYLIQSGLEQHNEIFISKGWKIVERNQNRISSLILDMLTFSKDRKPELIRDNLNRVVSEVVELMQDRAASANVFLTWTPDENLPDTLFDPEAIHHAVLNLVTNAIDAVVEAMEQDENELNAMKTVRISDLNSSLRLPDAESVFADGSHIFDENSEVDEEVTEEESASGSCTSMPCGQIDVLTQYDKARNVIRIFVKDTGPGLTKEQVACIFRPFESSKGNRGTGLGLPVCKKIIREHGGTIHVEPRTPRGSRFVITLPVIQD